MNKSNTFIRLKMVNLQHWKVIKSCKLTRSKVIHLKNEWRERQNVPNQGTLYFSVWWVVVFLLNYLIFNVLFPNLLCSLQITHRSFLYLDPFITVFIIMFISYKVVKKSTAATQRYNILMPSSPDVYPLMLNHEENSFAFWYSGLSPRAGSGSGSKPALELE